MPQLRRHYLSSRLTRLLLKEFEESSGIPRESFGRKPSVEIVKSEKFDLFMVNGKPSFARVKGRLVPVLSSPLVELLPAVVVDMGAVPHVCNGADVMVPGIVEVSEFEAGKLVVVRDERHRKPLVVGEALMSSEEIRRACRGKAVRNLHYVGDRVWKLIKELGKK